MKITERICEHGASDIAIAQLEVDVGAPLPSDYRVFLKTSNGGRPSPRAFIIQSDKGPTEDAVQFFFTLDDRSRHYRIRREIELLHDRIPEKTLPIACDSFGNILLLDVGAKAYGAIYFWDHENENMEGGPWWDNISPVAGSFGEFIESLYD